MNLVPKGLTTGANRRSFIKKGLAAAGAATAGAGLLAGAQANSGQMTQGDAAILRFHAALEILETDFWVQYNELGGVQDSEVPGGSGNPIYTAKLAILHADLAHIIYDHNDASFTYHKFF